MFLVRWEICHLLCWELVRPLGLGLPKVAGTEEGIELAGFCDLSGCSPFPPAARERCSWLGQGGGDSWNLRLELALPAEQTTQCPRLKI